MRDKKLRRSLLYVPGISNEMMDKALKYKADSVILDLEDAVSTSEKTKARQLVKKQICKFRERNIEIIVRINDVKTQLGVLDIEAVVEELPDAIIVPNSDEEAILMTDILLQATELRYGINKKIEIIPLLETSYGIANAYTILKTSKRVSAVQLGAEDLTKEMSIERTVIGKEIEYARNTISNAGHACKIDILDTPLTKLNNDESLIKDTKTAKDLGFTGKTCIHPKQISIINNIYTPDFEKVKKAKRLLEVYDEAVKSGKGVCIFEGEMVDLPVAERAQDLIGKAHLIAKYNDEK